MYPIDLKQIRYTYARALATFFGRPVDEIVDHEVVLWVYLNAATFADRTAA